MKVIKVTIDFVRFDVVNGKIAVVKCRLFIKCAPLGERFTSLFCDKDNNDDND